MKHYLFIIVSSLFLATIGMFVKRIGTDMPIMTVNFYRVFFAFLFLIVTVPFLAPHFLRIKKSDIKSYIFIGFLLALDISLFTTANRFAPVQDVALIVSFYPFFVLFLARKILHERFTKTHIVTLFIASVGLFLINPFNEGQFFLGHILSLITALSFALLVTLMRKENKNHSIADIFWFFFFATLFLLPMPFIFGFGPFKDKFFYIFSLGFLATGPAYLFFNLALHKLSAETASIIETIITPLTSVLLALFIIREPYNFRVLLGGAILIVAGIYLEAHKKRLKGKM